MEAVIEWAPVVTALLGIVVVVQRRRFLHHSRFVDITGGLTAGILSILMHRQPGEWLGDYIIIPITGWYNIEELISYTLSHVTATMLAGHALRQRGLRRYIPNLVKLSHVAILSLWLLFVTADLGSISTPDLALLDTFWSDVFTRGWQFTFLAGMVYFTYIMADCARVHPEPAYARESRLYTLGGGCLIVGGLIGYSYDNVPFLRIALSILASLGFLFIIYGAWGIHRHISRPLRIPNAFQTWKREDWA